MKNVTFKSLTTLCLFLSTIASPGLCLATSAFDKAKYAIDDAADALKKGVEAFKDDLSAAQDYLNNYHWKGLIQDEAADGPVTLKHLKLNDHPRAVAVKPGEQIHGAVLCDLDREKSSTLSVYQVVLGIKGQGAQTTLTEFMSGEHLETFTLTAPSEPGVYQVRFRLVETLLTKTALNSWKDANGKEPDGTKTIGIIYVGS